MSFAEQFNRSWDDIENLPAEQRAEARKEFMRVRELEQNTHLRNAYDTIIGIHNHTSVQSALNNIPAYHGTTPLKDFVQDIKNYRDTIPKDKEQEFLRGLIAKIRGEARKCLTNEDIQSVDELIKVLKLNFAPRKSYVHYVHELMTACMNKKETPRQFYHRLRVFINAALTAAKEDLTEENADLHDKPYLELIALKTFVKGLPDTLKPAIALSKPKTLIEAL
ncbi:hypothetical protein QAD02_007263 [Eretmocerus hayati]|uniref:Uncharacterized protein n=1 Tax=Eretmocerus hayati TaxID=131215 RepID=A0ACC2N3H7_9HYME|nr:hypothetical protein QAD02_007263 [Eretmocerus hayati]